MHRPEYHPSPGRIEETRDGIEKLLKVDGYRVESARTVEEATLKARFQPPDLLLVSLAGSTAGIIRVAKQIREQKEGEMRR